MYFFFLILHHLPQQERRRRPKTRGQHQSHGEQPQDEPPKPTSQHGTRRATQKRTRNAKSHNEERQRDGEKDGGSKQTRTHGAPKRRGTTEQSRATEETTAEHRDQKKKKRRRTESDEAEQRHEGRKTTQETPPKKFWFIKKQTKSRVVFTPLALPLTLSVIISSLLFLGCFSVLSSFVLLPAVFCASVSSSARCGLLSARFRLFAWVRSSLGLLSAFGWLWLRVLRTLRLCSYT